jgi:hypothetical protein
MTQSMKVHRDMRLNIFFEQIDLNSNVSLAGKLPALQQLRLQLSGLLDICLHAFDLFSVQLFGSLLSPFFDVSNLLFILS